MIGVRKKGYHSRRTQNEDGSYKRKASPERIESMRNKLKFGRQRGFMKSFAVQMERYAKQGLPQDQIIAQVKHLEQELRKRGYDGPEIANLDPKELTREQLLQKARVPKGLPPAPQVTPTENPATPVQRPQLSPGSLTQPKPSSQTHAGKVTGVPAGQQPMGLMGAMEQYGQMQDPTKRPQVQDPMKKQYGQI